MMLELSSGSSFTDLCVPVNTPICKQMPITDRNELAFHPMDPCQL